MTGTQPQTRPTIAIVGSGPSGCYSTQFLTKAWPDAEVTVFDRTPTPYGLVRYGVAPDHQGTKAVTRQFERVFESENVTFAGNISIGQFLTLDDLREAYDVVLLATGLWRDRVLGIEGEDLPGVHGSGQLTRLINSHPDETPHAVVMTNRTVIVGQGNVAIDLARFLVKTHDQFADSDLDPDLADTIRPEAAKEVHLVGRSGAVAAKFDPVMVKELAALPQVRIRVDPQTLETLKGESHEDLDKEAKKRVEALLEIANVDKPEATVDVHFHFGWTPVRVSGDGRAEALDIARVDDSSITMTIACDTVLKAIGYEHEAPGSPLDPEHYESADLETGRLDTALYITGWARRGPRGTIPDNRKDAQLVTNAITEDLKAGVIQPAKPGYAGLNAEHLESAVNFQGWQRIDQTERDSAHPERTRTKIRSREDMLRLASETPSIPNTSTN